MEVKMMSKKELMRAVKFLLLSISAGIIQIIVFELMWNVIEIPLWWVCNLTALVLSVLWNFTLNRKFTFKSANNIPVAMLKVAIFYAVFTPLSAWGGTGLVDGLNWNGDLVQVLTMLVNFVLEFLYYKFVVFRGSIDSAVKEEK